MRIVHVSDSHLGYTAYRRVTAEGYNQRGEDICAAFSRAIDAIIELKPDIVLHTGDLFDSPRPLNRIIEFAYRELQRLQQAKIPVLLLAGNHETPKQKNIGHVFALLDIFTPRSTLGADIQPGGMYAVYQDRYEMFTYQDHCFHAVPQCDDQKAFEEELAKVTLVKGKINIGLFHAGVSGLKEFREADLNELMLTTDFFSQNRFDHCALGHLHRMVEVLPKVWFAGSTERLSFNEVAQRKGFLVIDTVAGTIAPHYIPVRDMREDEIDASGRSAEEVNLLLQKALSDMATENAIVRIKVHQIAPAVHASLDFSALRALTSTAIHSELIFDRTDTEALTTSGGATIRGLVEEFTTFITENVSLEKKERLRERGVKVLREAMEE